MKLTIKGLIYLNEAEVYSIIEENSINDILINGIDFCISRADADPGAALESMQLNRLLSAMLAAGSRYGLIDNDIIHMSDMAFSVTTYDIYIEMVDEDTLLEQRIETAAKAAEEAFWGTIAGNFPEAISGTIPLNVDEALKGWTAAWVEINVSK